MTTDQAIKILEGAIKKPNTIDGYLGQALTMAINSLKNQPEIIRCRDCKWWDKQEMSLQGRCGLFQMYPTGEWYCGNAKLRSDSDEVN